MASQQDKGKEKMPCTDSLSDDSDSVRPCKRPRQPAPEQNSNGSLKIRDTTGWQHGVMIDENRHWKCKYCHMVGRSGGVTSLKHHVAGGSSRVRACLSAPKDVSNEVKRLLDSTRQKRRKWTSRKGTVVQPAMATTSEPKNPVPLPSGVLSDSTPNDSTNPEEDSEFPSSASFMTHLCGHDAFCRRGAEGGGGGGRCKEAVTN